MKNYSKIFKILMWVLVVVSVALLVYGFAVGFESNGGAPVDTLFYWAYAMCGLAVASVVIVGLIISTKNNPKSLFKILIGVVAIVAVCAVAYFLSAGKPAMGMLEQPSAGTLKLTDTILNLTYFVGATAIVSIIFGEIVMAVRNRK